MSPKLVAPFPWYGGKRRWSDRVLIRFGHIDVYSEPFAGSLAVLLASPPHKREVVCDTDGGICNFWRALAADPDAVAHWADYPTIHDDLTARHRYLVRWVIEHADELRNDPDYFDAKVAGWWVWGISIWIGGGWCQPSYRKQAAPDRIPKFAPTAAGVGIHDKRPKLFRGTHPQRPRRVSTADEHTGRAPSHARRWAPDRSRGVRATSHDADR